MKTLRIALATFACVGLVACSPETSAQVSAESTSSIKESTSTTESESAMIIDVRTPEEFASGHLQGAVNFDVNDEEFKNQVKDLDKNASYILYCRSGNRAHGAQEYMESIGFTDVKNLGSVQEASEALGIDVVVEK